MALEPGYTLRPEEPRDHAAIFDLTKRAFAPMPFADGNDQHIVPRLRDAGALSLSLVVDQDGVVIGHVALSPVTHESGAKGWFGLGTLAVEPALQRRGLGTALIAGAKDWLLQSGARGCILLGDLNYYPRHGFLVSPDHAPENEPAAYFMIWAPDAEVPPGRFRFHPAFYA